MPGLWDTLNTHTCTQVQQIADETQTFRVHPVSWLSLLSSLTIFCVGIDSFRVFARPSPGIILCQDEGGFQETQQYKSWEKKSKGTYTQSEHHLWPDMRCLDSGHSFLITSSLTSHGDAANWWWLQTSEMDCRLKAHTLIYVYFQFFSFGCQVAPPCLPYSPHFLPIYYMDMLYGYASRPHTHSRALSLSLSRALWCRCRSGITWPIASVFLLPHNTAVPQVQPDKQFYTEDGQLYKT